MKIMMTGAHFTPAQAVIEQLKKNSNVEIVYVGRSTTLEGDPSASAESQVLPTLGVEFIPIIAGRLQRSFTVYTIPSLLKIPIGFIQALYIILFSRPDVILSFGGYVSVPTVLVGWLFSIPILIHEQGLVSGLANKICAFFADKIALSFNKDDSFNGKLTVLTGNPLRRSIVESHQIGITNEYSSIFTLSRRNNLPVVLIMGGNQGSHTINRIVEECLDKLTKMACIIHVTGDNKFHDFERLQKLQNEHYLVKKWLGEEYGALLSRVDLVVSRAGINTLTELAYMGKPALVIPIPYLYSDEQNKNAKYFADLGLVRILSQSRLSAYMLMKNVRLILNHLNHFKKSTKKAKSVVIPDAAKRLALETILLTDRS